MNKIIKLLMQTTSLLSENIDPGNAGRTKNGVLP